MQSSGRSCLALLSSKDTSETSKRLAPGKEFFAQEGSQFAGVEDDEVADVAGAQHVVWNVSAQPVGGITSVPP